MPVVSGNEPMEASSSAHIFEPSTSPLLGRDSSSLESSPTCSSPNSPSKRRKRNRDPEFIPDTPGQRILGEMRGGTTPFLTNATLLISVDRAAKTNSCHSDHGWPQVYSTEQ